MTVRFDLLKLPLNKKRSITRLAARLLRELPDTHTIVIDKKPGIMRAKMLNDFELFVFVNAGTREKAETVRSASRLPSDTYDVYDPRMAYKRRDRQPQQRETEALHYRYSNIYEGMENSFRNFLHKHLKFFIKEDFLDITTINSEEMKRDNPLYYRLYLMNRFEKGSPVYCRQAKPNISLPGRGHCSAGIFL